ncbi:hypothetical protein CONLIGDRAFT_482252 [Coniochaeta ligniaria NRRL 30616]|uniref:Uncharacterized protein n=1 Tax=Coniochaeta ligniaria NRRL 30616 TaxID=1408157 RepID=A0A1J7IGX2_9PEZI|nr:hypothetical protein CONLIGDRAFT_482252 [Coniochaeta ligniaria NRRL 30616]
MDADDLRVPGRRGCLMMTVPRCPKRKRIRMSHKRTPRQGTDRLPALSGLSKPRSKKESGECWSLFNETNCFSVSSIARTLPRIDFSQHFTTIQVQLAKLSCPNSGIHLRSLGASYMDGMLALIRRQSHIHRDEKPRA